MRLATTLAAALTATAFMAIGCGESDSDEQTAKAPKLAPAAVIDEDPYAISCGHVRDQQEWALVTKQANVAVANRERFRGMTLHQASQSLFFAMTELCKGRAPSFRPTESAVQGVREGKFRAYLGEP